MGEKKESPKGGSVFDINFGHLRIQPSVPIFTQECDY